MSAAIQYIERKEIDIAKWDQCIAEADNGLIYGYSWYLDHMADNWDALVLNDYEAVMPLTWRRKYTIKYLYQPPFCQQLGVYGKRSAYHNQVAGFLSAAQQAFPFIEICLNFDNVQAGTIAKNNFILPLNKSYEQLYQDFQYNLKHDISKAQKEGLSYHPLSDYSKAIELYRAAYGKRFRHVTNAEYNRLHKLCGYLYSRGNLVVRATGSGSNIMALSLLLHMNGRLLLLLSVTFPEGRQLRANHFHINALIQEFSNRALILDFEGSDIPGVAHFYKSFGAVSQPYYYFHSNHLPLMVRWLKG